VFKPELRLLGRLFDVEQGILSIKYSAINELVNPFDSHSLVSFSVDFDGPILLLLVAPNLDCDFLHVFSCSRTNIMFKLDFTFPQAATSGRKTVEMWLGNASKNARFTPNGHLSGR
jgi:hypothetical protein